MPSPHHHPSRYDPDDDVSVDHDDDGNDDDGSNTAQHPQQHHDSSPSALSSDHRLSSSLHSPMITHYMRLPDLIARETSSAGAGAASGATMSTYSGPASGPPSSAYSATSTGGGGGGGGGLAPSLPDFDFTRNGQPGSSSAAAAAAMAAVRRGRTSGRNRSVSLGGEPSGGGGVGSVGETSWLLGAPESWRHERQQCFEFARDGRRDGEASDGGGGQERQHRQERQQQQQITAPLSLAEGSSSSGSCSCSSSSPPPADGGDPPPPYNNSSSTAQETVHKPTNADTQKGAAPPPTSQYDPSNPFAGQAPNPPLISLTYGLINASIVLPVLVSFGSIIYHDEFFRPYLPVLVKLTIVSGVVHQLCFSLLSTLPFAVGQVQDAGLIFLSKMASDVVVKCRQGGYDDAHTLATVTIGLGLCTALLGLGLYIIGKCRLASYVQLLPTPVVGGYLAYIGFFCGQGGMSIMAGTQVSGLAQWGAFFTAEAIILILPGLVGGISIYLLVRRIRHMAVLPCCIVALVGAFYAALALTGTTVQQARDNGWVSDAEPPPVWYRTWDYLRFDKVVWSALPSQALTLVSMTLVVALSSSLDVAAIELELGRPLDYNRELRTVGLSNVVSGLTGGYTGSYIFSQSIFSLRAGIRSRMAGYVLAACEAAVFVAPVSALSYVPNFFFGSLLTLIAVDLMHEWLWDVRKKVTPAEFGIDVLTFGLIHVCGVEYGIILGLLVYLVCARMGLDLGGSNAASGGGDCSACGTDATSAPSSDGEVEEGLGGSGGEDKAVSGTTATDEAVNGGSRNNKAAITKKKTLSTIESGASLDNFSNYGSTTTDDVSMMGLG